MQAQSASDDPVPVQMGPGNNPGNLRDNAWTQSLPGYAGTSGGFAVFATPEAGAAAMGRNLSSYAKKGIQTVSQLTNRWAPAGDGANDPVAYAATVSRALGIKPDDPIDLSDPTVQARIIPAMASVEHGGRAPVPVAMNAAGIRPAAPVQPLNDNDIGSLWSGAAPAQTGSPPAQPLADHDLNSMWEGPSTPATTASALAPGSYPLGDPRNNGMVPTSYTNGTPVGGAVNDVVDPTAPIGQQLATAGRAAAGYVGQQVSGIPAAISTAYSQGGALAQRGNALGPTLPSFPSADPSTWQLGGALSYLAGRGAQLSSPLTGTIDQLVQQPVTDATGSPDIGARAGFVANTLAAPALGRVLGSAASSAASGVLGGLDPETAQLASLAQGKYGIPIYAPQMGGGKGLQIAASASSRLPLSGAPAAEAAQQGAWLRGVAGTIGEDADRLTPQVMNAARQRIGNYYDTVAANTNLSVDPQFLQDIHDTLNHANLTLTQPESDVLIRQAQNILQKIDPSTRTISGETYQALTKTGSPLDNLVESDNPNIGNAANSLKRALDGALTRSAAPQYQDMLSTADRQWAALKTIQPLAAKSPTGQISPALLAGRVNASTGNGMAFGWGGDLGELARIGQRFMKEPGSSNTAERSLTYGALGAAGSNALMAASGALTPGEIAAQLIGVPAGLLANRAISGATRSQWLTNSLINHSLGRVAPSGALSLPLTALGAANATTALNRPVSALSAPNQ